MEKELRIPVSKRYAIYGRFRGSKRLPLFIIVPGLGVDINYSLYCNAVHWFAEHGFSTFRFDFYGWQKDARQLQDGTLASQADDLDAIVLHFRKQGFKRIFVAGHSFGCPTILLSKVQGFDAASIWDPSYKISFEKKAYGYPGGKHIKQLKGYLMRWGVNVLIGEKMSKETDSLHWDNLAKTFKKPLQVIVAGSGLLMDGAKQYYQCAPVEKKFFVIKGAEHAFDSKPRQQDEVYKKSYEWFSRFLIY